MDTRANNIRLSGPFPNGYDGSLIEFIGALESANGIEVMMARCMVVARHYKGMEGEAWIMALESKLLGLIRLKSKADAAARAHWLEFAECLPLAQNEGRD